MYYAPRAVIVSPLSELARRKYHALLLRASDRTHINARTTASRIVTAAAGAWSENARDCWRDRSINRWENNDTDTQQTALNRLAIAAVFPDPC